MSTRRISLEKASKFAISAIRQHLGSEWKLSWSTSSTYLGSCYHAKKTIEISKKLLTDHPESELLDTVLHEIAHALVGKRVKAHGIAWQKMAYKLGARPFASSK